MPKWKVGADPEFFLKKGRSYVSAHDLLPGTKAVPYQVKDGAIQVDGTAVEYNINPASCSKEFVDNNVSVLGEIRGMLPDDYSFIFRPHVMYRQEYYDKLPDYSKLLGCEPDFCAYSKGQNPPPVPIGTMRTAAGHLHFGWTEGKDVNDPGHMEDGRMLVQMLDQHLYPVSLVWDGDTQRRRMYGKMGSYRIKPYGVEYRPLSCAWLTEEDLMAFVYDVGIFCLNMLYLGTKPRHYKTEQLANWNIFDIKNVSYDVSNILRPRANNGCAAFPHIPIKHMCTRFQRKLEVGGYING